MACGLWLKVLDWLRVFPTTSFYISLIIETVVDIRPFLVIMGIWYMMFGTAFYLLSFNRSEENALVPDISPIWLFDAFQTQYELSTIHLGSSKFTA